MDSIKWLVFMEKANEELLKKKDIDFGSAFIALIIEPSFHNHFRVFINWNDKKESVIWEKLTWEKLVDVPKFYDKQQIYEDLTPTMSIQKGNLEKTEISMLIDKIKSIAIKPQLNLERGWTLDGTFYTLKVGRSSDSMTFSWHTLPEGWDEFETLIDEILAVEDRVIKEDTPQYNNIKH